MIERRRVGWRSAMSTALYGETGFYLAAGSPGRNFRTAAHTSPLWASAIHSLAVRVAHALGTPPGFTVVDVGAGGGELLASLAELAPPDWSLHGVDIAPRPTSLPERVSWSADPPESFVGLLIAAELLDVVPLDVAELADDGARLVVVSASGDEQIGEIVTGADAEWLTRWWPLTAIGDRADIGWPRDDIWRSLTSHVDHGVALAIDYAAVPSRDVAGTLTAYRNGRQVPATPDGSCDLTAHVRFESLLVAGDVVMSQREALAGLGIAATRPGYDGDPAAYLAALSTVGEAAELLDRDGLGDFTWFVHARGMATDDVDALLRGGAATGGKHTGES